MTQNTHTNRLSAETSPYLLQHAQNPVDWYPWGAEALERARAEDKPILLSIGYSACHWCHVMAHESFEDADTAAAMNEKFINIKVDREERPDLDKIYQLSHQLLTRRSGGWPLTVFLNPHDHIPFFSGTYFPKEPRYNLPGFVGLLSQISSFYAERKNSLGSNGEAFRDVLRRISAGEQGNAASALDPSVPAKLLSATEASLDRVNGGFGGAPKFPHPSSLEFLLQQAGESASAREMLMLTLERMAAGGIYDQLGGGFCRYSVDAEWQIPHFEKMLYDNGPLLGLYARTWQLSGAAGLASVTTDTAEWVIREMQSPEGGYFSSLDADSEGEEGKFYVWDRQEVKDLLSADEYTVASLHYGLDDTPNFEGQWHLRVALPLAEVANRLKDDSPAHVQELLAAARAKLFLARAGRVRPGLDDKILTSWNALMIKGMVIAGRVLERGEFIASAGAAFDFLRARLWRDGRLLATYKDGQARHAAYLDDYAFLIDAGLELLQSRWQTSTLLWIQQLADDLLARFESKAHGGFYFTGDDHEALIHRPLPLGDEAMPSGNGVAARALARLGHLLGEQVYLDAAERVLRGATEALQRHPEAHASLCCALDEWLRPPRVIVIRGAGEDAQAWRRSVQNVYQPRSLCFNIPPEETDLPGLLAQRPYEGATVAYVCEAGVCLPPVHSLQGLQILMGPDS